MKTIDAEILDAALTKCINNWAETSNPVPYLDQIAMTTLIDVRQCVREAAGIDKTLTED